MANFGNISDFQLDANCQPLSFIVSWNIKPDQFVNTENLRNAITAEGLSSKVPMPTSRTSIVRACKSCVGYLNSVSRKEGKYDFKKVEDDAVVCKYTVYRVATNKSIKDLNMDISSHLVWSKGGTGIDCDGAEATRLHDLYIQNLNNCNDDDLRVFARNVLKDECRGISYHEGVYIVSPKCLNTIVKLDSLLKRFDLGHLDVIPLYPVAGQVEMITEKFIIHMQQKMSEVREKLSTKSRSDAFVTMNNDVVDMNTLMNDYKEIVKDVAVFSNLKKEMDSLANDIALKM